MTLAVRTATGDDLDAVAALTRAHRHRLAGWSPTWWTVAAGADELHPLWLGHLVGTGAVRVVVDGEDVVACVAANRQGGQWFLDDLATDDDDRWPEVLAALVPATERPGLSCTATKDATRLAALAAAGFTNVSAYWVAPVGAVRGGEPRPRPCPPHTFGIDLDAERPVSVPAPPVYDPGGTVALAAAGAEGAAGAVAAKRGDVLLAVVAAPDDDLAPFGFERTVEVHRWP